MLAAPQSPARRRTRTHTKIALALTTLAKVTLADNVCGASVTFAWRERQIAAAGDRTGRLRVR
jgi:hypothetical protein